MSNVSSPEMMQRVTFWTAQIQTEIGAVGVHMPGPFALPGLCKKIHFFHVFYIKKKKKKTNNFHICRFTHSGVSAFAFLFISEHIFALLVLLCTVQTPYTANQCPNTPLFSVGFGAIDHI